MTVQMNTEVKAQWIEALTSGRFPQGREQLARKGTYCCLGVLCEVAIDEGVIVAYEPSNPFPPAKVMAWAGLQVTPDATTCVEWNDEQRLSFAEIAARLA